MKPLTRSMFAILSVAASVLAAASLSAQTQTPAIEPPPPVAEIPRDKDYNAQVRPKIAVMRFENTNELAKRQGYGESVSAMLVTFLKGKSQLVMIERQSLDKVLENWKLNNSGATTAVNASEQQVLDEIDAIIQGKVTVLGDAPSEQEKRSNVSYNYDVEIDATLTSVRDAHIISAAHQSGKASCLREIVGRLGIELEQGILKPYYGGLRIHVQEPANVRIFLSPILSKDAKADERPAVQLSATAVGEEGGEKVYKRWVTNPNSYLIQSLLGGWYTMRLEHPGYEAIAAENSRYEVCSTLGLDARPTRAGTNCQSPADDPLIVRVVAGEISEWPASNESAAFNLKKQGGSLRIRVQREFIDKAYVDLTSDADFRSVVSSLGLRMNDRSDLDKWKARATGHAEQEVVCTSEAVTHDLAPAADVCERKRDGEPFFASHVAGEVSAVDYHRGDDEARRLPAGPYLVRVGYPGYERAEQRVNVTGGEQTVDIPLKRVRGKVIVEFDVKPKSETTNKIILEGSTTKQTRTVPLTYRRNPNRNENEVGVIIPGLPIDTYVLRTDLAGFEKWRKTLYLGTTDAVEVRDVMATKPEENDCTAQISNGMRLDGANEVAASVQLKTQVWVSGRTDQMHLTADTPPYRNVVKELLAFVPDVVETVAGQAAQPKQTAVLLGRKGADDTAERIKQLADELNDIDLVYLNDQDLRRLAKDKRMAEIFRRYVDRGGAIYAFVSAPGDYSGVLGDGIVVTTESVQKGVFELRPGNVASVKLNIKKDSARRDKRAYPVLKVADKDQPPAGWNVVARRGKREPACILERGEPETGRGYVLVWLDSPDKVADEPIGREVMTMMDGRAIAAAQASLYNRLDAAGEAARTSVAMFKTTLTKSAED